MVECDYCDKEFDSETELHLHWSEEHEDELNSHEKEKVKKAQRKKEEEEDAKMRKRKQYAGYGLGIALTVALIGIVGAQVMQSSGGNSAELGTLEGQPSIGNADASVTVVEFGDYACPHCRDFELNTFSQLKDNYIDNDRINFKFVNYAFLGESSTEAAVASECVYRQDEEQFWDYHKALFENQGSPEWTSTDNLVSTAEASTEGLNYEELRSCINGQETLDEVQKDRRIANQAGVRSTPTVFLNGEKVNNWQYNNLAQAIDEQLQ
jgi:protein-disulfide isomerase